MALPSTGSISFSQINVEIKRAATNTLSLNDATVRKLAGKTSGAISMADLRGKSYEVHYVNTTNRTNASIFSLMGSPTVANTYVFENRAVISAGSGSYALRTGTFPAGSILKIINKGTIRGKGGNGGAYNANGAAGGTALYIDMNCSLDNSGGTISGGGGGGGGGRAYQSALNIEVRAPGGGGAGSNAGGTTGSTTGTGSNRQPASGTATGGGVGGRNIHSASGSTLTAGSGGARGAAGGNSSWVKGTSLLSYTGRVGGAGGRAIARNGKTVTIINGGTRHGATS